MQAQNVQQSASMNHEYQAASVIQMRLDTTKLLADAEGYYRGTRVSGYKEEAGAIKPIFDAFGQPRMNLIGVQAVMGWLALLITPQTVQGNKKEEEYAAAISRIEADIATDLMINLIDYEISEHQYSGLVDTTSHTMDFFFSRTINDGERQSYANTFRSVERVGEQGRGWKDMLPFLKS